MKPSDLLRTLRSLGARPGRTVLTLLGIVIGSGAIVLVAGLVAGGKAALMRTSQEATGSDLVRIRSRKLPSAELVRARPELSRADGEALAQNWAAAGSPAHAESSRTVRARFVSRRASSSAASSTPKRKKVRMVSGNPRVAGIYGLQVRSGRFLNARDLHERRRVCVVGHEVWVELMSRTRLSSQPSIAMDGQLWKVVGVLAPKPIMGSTTGTNIWDRKVLVPETTFDASYAPDHRVDVITVAAARHSGSSLSVVSRVFERLLLRRHHGAHNFKIEDRAGGQMEQLILGIVEALLIATGALALLVGGINVMNVMLVNVSERTREIGIRRALGATRRSIAMQFLLESSLLSVIGGVIGVTGGSALVHAAAAGFSSWLGYFPGQVETWSVALGLGLSLTVGIVFGLLPALRASRLHPVVALRSE